MRILYSHRIHSRDGQSVHVDELVAAFRANGNEVLVVGPTFYETTQFGQESWIVAKIRRFLPTWLKELAEITDNATTFLRLYKASRTFAPDFIYERYNLYLLAGAWLARWTGIQFYLEINSPLAEERRRFGQLRFTAFARMAEDFVWRRADRLFVVTTNLKEIVAESGVGQQHIHVVPNGVVLERFPEPPRQRSREGITLGFVGFLRTWHGMDTVLEAMSKYAGPVPLRLIIVGDGPARPELEAQVAALGLSNSVEFMGVVPFDHIPSVLSKFDIALQPKAVPYASPLKIFDYMAAGLAIVAPDQPNIREILQHRVTALLFDPECPDAMWHSIAELIETPQLIDQIGIAARTELVSSNYTWTGNAERITTWAEKDKKLVVQTAA